MASAEKQFDEFYTAHYAALAAQMAAYLGDRAEAEDIAQEAFGRAWRRWAQISRYDNPIGWVHTVAYRMAVSRWRRLRTVFAHRLRHRPEVVPPPDPGRLDLISALATLPDAQRRVLVLPAGGGLRRPHRAVPGGQRLFGRAAGHDLRVRRVQRTSSRAR